AGRWSRPREAHWKAEALPHTEEMPGMRQRGGPPAGRGHELLFEHLLPRPDVSLDRTLRRRDGHRGPGRALDLDSARTRSYQGPGRYLLPDEGPTRRYRTHGLGSCRQDSEER